MLVFPNCKINLGLQIVSKRADGFHNIESVMVPVGWTDMLEIIPAKTNSFFIAGNNIGCKVENNLCYKVYELLKKEFDLPPVSLYLYKKIPHGAGLGGGSSDAAFTLKTLNELFSLGLNTEILLSYAAKLGSDCPFFITNHPSFATGKGDYLLPIDLPIKGLEIAIIKPEIAISTAEAYSSVIPKDAEYSICEILKQNIRTWRQHLKNDFETAVFKKYPELEQIKNKLYDKGALYASMSGSGSAIYGIFEKKVDLKSTFRDLQIWQGCL